MQEESLTRARSSQIQSNEDDFLYQQSNQIFYYSNFSLFQNQTDQNQFYQYSIFMEKVSTQLGREWKQQANTLYKPYFSSRQVFMNLLEIWLQHHPITSLSQNKRHSKFTFNQSYVDQFLARMKQDMKRKYGNQDFKIQNVAVKAVCIGFFMTSNQIWEEMFQKQNTSKPTLFSKQFFLNGVTKTIEKTFQPVMVVTQKISSVFGKKKIKPNEQVQAQDCDSGKFQNCFQQFQKTLDIQRQVQRKLSECNLDEIIEVETKQSNKIISSKEFKENQSPVQNKLISSVYDYLTNFMKIQTPWEVASHFVTNILDMKYLKTQEGTKVKVLKPAQGFYQKLVFVWLLLKQDKDQIKFDQYLQSIRSKFGQEWKQKYIIPTKFFFDRITKDWAQIKKQTSKNIDLSLQDKSVLATLLKRIRKGMKSQWDSKIKLNPKRLSKSDTYIGVNSQFYRQNVKMQNNHTEY